MNKRDFVFSHQELKKYLLRKNPNLKKVLEPAVREKDFVFSLLLSKYYINLIDWLNPEDPIRKMAVTTKSEKEIKKYELKDPIGDKLNSPVPGIIHRHKDRCLLNLTNACAMHCRFCFRRNLLSHNKANLTDCLKYINGHEEIWEVVLSGGDPFMMTDSFLRRVVSNLREIKHVKIIRFHSKVPTVYPKRITGNLIKILKSASPTIISIHVNHPREITPEFIKAVNKLKKANLTLLSATVLLKGVNNDVLVLEELFRKLVEIGVKPYYIHHLDLSAGTDHFRISIEEGKGIMKKLRENTSGVCIPEYTVDIPGGLGKVPVSELQRTGKNKYSATNSDGRKIIYEDFYGK